MDPSGVVAIVPAAGSGLRLGAGVPKAFVELGGVPMVLRAVDGLLGSDVVGRVVVVVPSAEVAAASSLFPGRPVTVVAGGASRTASVAAGLRELAPDVDVVLVHDAARPLTPPEVVRRVVAAVRSGLSAVIPVLPVADTVKRVDDGGVVTGNVDRSPMRAVQTPQGFRAGDLVRAYDGVADALTDDAGLVEALGGPVHTVDGDPEAFKVTTAWDLRIAELLIAGAGAPEPVTTSSEES